MINLNIDIPLVAAESAFRGTSFSPEKRGQTAINDYVSMLSEDLKEIQKIAPDSWETEFETFRDKAQLLYIAWLNSHAHCISTMITGPANFPTANAKKRNQWADNAYNKFMYFRHNAKKAIKRKNAKNVDALEIAKSKLASEIKLHEAIKAGNAIIRSKKFSDEEKIEKLKSVLTVKDPSSLLTPDYAGRIGFPSYHLTNGNARIKNLKARIAELEIKKNNSGKEIATIFTAEGYKIIKNFQEDRIQILFDEKPSATIRYILKSNAYKWSSKNTAWQRKITNNAIYCLNKFLIPELTTN